MTVLGRVDEAVEDYIRALVWGDSIPAYAITLVAGNIRGAINSLIKDGILGISTLL